MLMTVLFCVSPAWPQTDSGVFFTGGLSGAGGDGRTVFLCVVRMLFSLCVLCWMKGMQSCAQLIDWGWSCLKFQPLASRLPDFGCLEIYLEDVFLAV